VYWSVIEPIQDQRSKIIASTCVIEEQLSIKRGQDDAGYDITVKVLVYNYLVDGIEAKLSGSCALQTCPDWRVRLYYETLIYLHFYRLVQTKHVIITHQETTWHLLEHCQLIWKLLLL
jgi:hypothetical protein